MEVHEPTEQDLLNFKEWLIREGAAFDKIEWPSYDTVNGVRGAVALEDIDTDEIMLQIPEHLLMSPPRALSDEEIGPALHESQGTVRSDLLLAVYIMHQYLKKEASFFYPYLRILPMPTPLPEWTQEELEQLQDANVVTKAKNRRIYLQDLYTRTFRYLTSTFPSIFSMEEYTLELFKFAWYTIEARAFGRRLPWSALVPFADCLNHANVQTKYDFDVQHNKKFRLFPTGANRYSKGSEVFNSYGRRHNENLLMEYGFAMVDNEWDRLEVQFALERSEENYQQKTTLLFRAGLGPVRTLRLRRDIWPADAVTFMRVMCLRPTAVLLLEWSERDATTPVSYANEFLAISKLIALIENLVREWPTTLEEDEALLTQPDLPYRLTCALRYRVTRKRIARSQLQMLTEVAQFLEGVAEGEAPLPTSPPAGHSPQLHAYFESLFRDRRMPLRVTEEHLEDLKRRQLASDEADADDAGDEDSDKDTDTISIGEEKEMDIQPPQCPSPELDREEDRNIEI